MFTRSGHRQDDCLAPGVLQDIERGNLSDEKIESIFDHVSHCDRCEKFLSEWGGPLGERVFAKLRKGDPRGPDAPTRESPALASLQSLRPTLDAPTLPRSAAFGRSLVGKMIGQCLIEEEIGHGGMGVVFRATQSKLKRSVAMKFIRLGDYAEPIHVARFQREAGAIARLQHPNVALLYDFDEFEGLPYFTMELVDGGSLADKLADGVLDCREAAALVATIAEGVDFAHQKHVIHRDLKPSNILLTTDGVPKIADFGLAKLLDDPESDVTRSNGVIGTPGYMAPEQAFGSSGDFGPRTDVYALGAILYECLTGEPPHRGKDRNETIQRLLHDEAISPTRLRPEVPSRLSAICLKCLEKSPERRYESARALADDLKLWLEGKRPVGIPSVFRRTRDRLRRNRIVAAIGLILVIAVTVASVAAALHDPDRAVKTAQARIADGQPVTLIGESGTPEWYRWLDGEATSKLGLASDRTTRLDAFEETYLELLPAVGVDRYRFEVQIRHEKSKLHGGVGIYAARGMNMFGHEPANSFMEVHFNDIIGKNDMPIMITAGQQPAVPQMTNEVHLSTRFRSQLGPPRQIDMSTSSKGGPKYEAVGEGKTTWRDVALIVTPEGITAEWDKQTIRISTEEMQTGLNRTRASIVIQSPLHPFLRLENPTIDRRGGLGLMIYGGSAAFRSARVIPLPGP